MALYIYSLKNIHSMIGGFRLSQYDKFEVARIVAERLGVDYIHINADDNARFNDDDIEKLVEFTRTMESRKE